MRCRVWREPRRGRLQALLLWRRGRGRSAWRRLGEPEVLCSSCARREALAEGAVGMVEAPPRQGESCHRCGAAVGFPGQNWRLLDVDGFELPGSGGLDDGRGGLDEGPGSSPH